MQLDTKQDLLNPDSLLVENQISPDLYWPTFAHELNHLHQIIKEIKNEK